MTVSGETFKTSARAARKEMGAALLHVYHHDGNAGVFRFFLHISSACVSWARVSCSRMKLRSP
jgi:hypothetical protein